MEPIYVQNFTVEDAWVDRYGRMKPSAILYLAQEMGGRHSALMSLDYDSLARRNLFWAVTRHRVQVTRLPALGEKVRVETWPLPTTRAAFPRSVVAYDAQGNEVFRCITLWVLMDRNIVYLQSEQKYTIFHLKDGKTVSSRKTLKEWIKELEEHRLIFTEAAPAQAVL